MLSNFRFNFRLISKLSPIVGQIRGAFSVNPLGYRRAHSNPASIARLQCIIHVIPASKDNYMYVIVDKESKTAAVIDPIDIKQISAFIESEQIKLKCVLTTHHLPDHAGGNRAISEIIPKIPIYGGDERVQAVTKIVRGGDLIKAGPFRFKCFLNPDEASGHVIYFLQNNSKEEPSSAFVGDTIFVGGIGNFPDSDHRQVFKAVNEVSTLIPEHTDLFCGHECTINNLKFALEVDPTNPYIKKKLDWAKIRRESRDPTIPSTLQEEKRYNPVFRLNEAAIQRYCDSRTPQETLVKLRVKKTEWDSNPR